MEQTAINLITRGDDLGAFKAGNHAILDAFRRGILRNASVMIPAPQIEHAVALVKQEPDLCLGLHVTLTSEWYTPRWGPVSSPEDVPSLVDEDGYFYKNSGELHKHGGKLDEMIREVRAQLVRARELGLNIRYMDEHMGVGWLCEGDDPNPPQRLEDTLRELASEEGLLWHRDLATTIFSYPSIEECTRSLPLLTAGTHVFVTHPALADEEMQQICGPDCPVAGHMAQLRFQDYNLLCHTDVYQTIHNHGIRLARYDDCLC